jgi:hypothetical protein
LAGKFGIGVPLFMRWHVIIGALILTSSSALADRVSLRGEALKQTLAGKTVRLDTPFGVAIPITFHGNGLMSGKAGVLEYLLGADADRGRWWVVDDRLCQKWFKWLDAQPSCMRLQQEGQRIFWERDDGLNGTATIEVAFAPGADGPPRALGGPIQPPEMARSLTATELHEENQPPEGVAKAVSHRHAAMRPTSKPALAASEWQQPPTGTSDYWNFALSSRMIPAFGEGARGQEDRWCEALEPIVKPDTASVPSLVYVDRLMYGYPATGWSAQACFTTEPALKEIAKLTVLTRSSTRGRN